MVQRSDRARNIFNSGAPGIALASEESSGSEFVEEEKPWPPTQDRLSRCRAQKQASRVPRPHSHLFRLSGGRARGSKHARRWENSMFLASLHEIPEEEFDAVSSVLPSHDSPLTRLHCSDKHMQIWCRFSSQSEEEQLATTRRGRHSSNEGPEKERGQGPVLPPSSEQRFKKIEPRIRALLQHNRHLPSVSNHSI